MGKDDLTELDGNKMAKEYQWLAGQSLSDYQGQWIAVANESIIAKDDILNNVMKEVEGLSLPFLPLFIRVPEGAIIQ